MSIEQQPEAWIIVNKETGYRIQVSLFPDLYNKDMFEVIPLYTHPKPEPLSDEEIILAYRGLVKKAIGRFQKTKPAHGIGVDDEFI